MRWYLVCHLFAFFCFFAAACAADVVCRERSYGFAAVAAVNLMGGCMWLDLRCERGGRPC